MLGLAEKIITLRSELGQDLCIIIKKIVWLNIVI